MPDPKPDTKSQPKADGPTSDKRDGEPRGTPEQKIPGKPISDMDPPGQEAPEGDQSVERQREVAGNDPAKLGKTGG
jgi:hypothetical protein